MGDTKKVFTAGRFGSRYGVGIRKRIVKIELKQKQAYHCPSCSTGRIKRVDRGIFLCRKCKTKFAGGTFFPQTLTGGIIKRMVAQKSFLPLAGDLEKIKETGGPSGLEFLVQEKETQKEQKHDKKAMVE